MATRPNTSERFWIKVHKTDKCWEWTAYLNKLGYGQFQTDIEGRRRASLSHRVSWILMNGEIPVGLSVLHRCDNPKCVRPDHLFLGTKLQNTHDMISKKRHVGIVRQKLTINEVEKIRRDPRPSRIVAADYGVCKSHVTKIKSGKNWKKRS